MHPSWNSLLSWIVTGKNGMLWFLFRSSCSCSACCSWAILKGTCKYFSWCKFIGAFPEKVPKILMFVLLAAAQRCIMQSFGLDHFGLTNRKDILRKFESKEWRLWLHWVGILYLSFERGTVIAAHGEFILLPVAGYRRGVSERLCGP